MNTFFDYFPLPLTQHSRQRAQKTPTLRFRKQHDRQQRKVYLKLFLVIFFLFFFLARMRLSSYVKILLFQLFSIIKYSLSILGLLVVKVQAKRRMHFCIAPRKM